MGGEWLLGRQVGCQATTRYCVLVGMHAAGSRALFAGFGGLLFKAPHLCAFRYLEARLVLNVCVALGVVSADSWYLWILVWKQAASYGKLDRYSRKTCPFSQHFLPYLWRIPIELLQY